MSRAILRIWVLTAGGFLLSFGGMTVVRVAVLGLQAPGESRWEALAAGVALAAGFGFLIGMASAPLSAPWLGQARKEERRSGPFALGLVTGLLGVFAVDLVGAVYGLAVIVGFVVFVHVIDAFTAPLRILAAVALVLGTHLFLQGQTYRVLRARQTVIFVSAGLDRLAERGEAPPESLTDIQTRLGRAALLFGIVSLEHDPWGYDYHYSMDPGDGSRVYMTWGADGMPGPDPAIDPGTPGADIDLRAALGLDAGDRRLPPRVRVIPGKPGAPERPD
jgi:hypothetical protein